MSKTNRLVLCKDDYKTADEFKNAIRDAIILLIEAGYIATVVYDEKEFGIVLIEFNYADLEYEDRHPYWLYPEEEESVVYKED